MNRKSVLVAITLTVAAGGFGRECTWTGLGGDNLFETAANWDGDPNTAPVAGDSLVFNSAGSTCVIFQNNPDISGIKVLKGNVYFGCMPSSNDGKGYVITLTREGTEIFVEQDSKLVSSNRWTSAIAANPSQNIEGVHFVKTGKGEFCQVKGQFDNVGYFHSVDIKAGIIEVSGQGVWQPRVTYVRTGALFRMVGSQRLGLGSIGYNQYPAFEIESDGTFELQDVAAERGAIVIGYISGNGKVRINGGSNTFRMILDRGPVTFGGQVEYANSGAITLDFRNRASIPVDQFKYILSSETAWAGATVKDQDVLRFSPTCQTYCLGQWNWESVAEPYEMIARDTDGNPISIQVGEMTWQSSSEERSVKDGNWFGGYVTSTKDTVTSLPKKTGIKAVAAFDKKGILDICEGAAFRMKGSSGTGNPCVQVNAGSDLVLTDSYEPGDNVTIESPCRILVNGGMIEASCLKFAHTDTFSIFGTLSTPLDVLVGTGGLSIRTCDTFNFGHPIYLARPISAEGVTDGGFTRLVGAGVFGFQSPLVLTGPVRLLDGKNVIAGSADSIAANPCYFGTGSLYMRNSIIALGKCPNGASLTFAPGTGSSLTYDGMATIQYRTNQYEGDSVKSVSVGGVQRGGKGAVLYLWDYCLPDSGLFDGTKSTFSVSGGLQNCLSGTTRQPIFIYSPYINRCFFSTCTSGGQLQLYSGYKTVWDPVSFTSNDIVSVESTAVSVEANSDVFIGGLKLSGGASKLTINEGATLHIGNGVDPAVVIVDKPYIEGEYGTIDFGTSEGVFAGIHEGTYYKTVICGENGVTFTAPPDLNASNRRWARLSNANKYRGGTYINSIRLSPENAGAFGYGDVYVGGGQDYGGRIYFNTSGLLFTNGFHVAGWGKHDLEAFDNQDGGGYGVLDFVANTEISGPVEVVEDVRVCCLNEGTVATISGEISGAGIQVYDGRGTLSFTHANTYTGRTEIVASTLKLSGDGTLGSGPVVLDGGTLVIDKEDAFSLANRISGKGTVRLEGRGVVTLAGGLEVKDFGGLVSNNFTLALGEQRRVTVADLKGFSAITTDRVGSVDIYVLDGESIASFTGTIPVNVTCHEGPFVSAGLKLIIR